MLNAPLGEVEEMYVEELFEGAEEAAAILKATYGSGGR